MSRIVRALALLLVVAFTAARGQPTPSHTLGSMLDSLSRAAHRADADPIVRRWMVVLDSLTKRVDAADARGVTLATMLDVSKRTHPGWYDIARLNRHENKTLGGLPDSTIEQLTTLHAGLFRALLAAHVAPESLDSLLKPTSDLGRELQKGALKDATAQLNRYEIKYGPSSPALNGVEVLLNFALQWIPPLAGGKDGPSAFELVASYSNSGATASYLRWNQVRLLSGTRLGIRIYDFDAPTTGNVLQRALRPTQFSFGWAALGALDAPLQPPLARSLRGGAFLGLGSVYTAFTAQGGRRLVIGTSQPLIPYVF